MEPISTLLVIAAASFFGVFALNAAGEKHEKEQAEIQSVQFNTNLEKEREQKKQKEEIERQKEEESNYQKYVNYYNYLLSESEKSETKINWDSPKFKKNSKFKSKIENLGVIFYEHFFVNMNRRSGEYTAQLLMAYGINPYDFRDNIFGLLFEIEKKVQANYVKMLVGITHMELKNILKQIPTITIKNDHLKIEAQKHLDSNLEYKERFFQENSKKA